ncbi:MAG: hypothetical protein C0490_27085 [Marivirga sp.]|nr:hypothetical protein [Marivirga sp.]
MDLVKRERLQVKTGVNPSLFFTTEKNAAGKELLRATRNLNADLEIRYPFPDNCVLALSYLYVHGFDYGTLSGHFLNASYSLADIDITKLVFIKLFPQLFYFDFDGQTNGLYASGNITFANNKIPISFYFQAVGPLWTNFPGSVFKWNGGIVYDY